jgi:ferredoxin-NADP reductase
VPLMCMLRHRRLSGGVAAPPAALLYSARTRGDVVYREELAQIAASDPAVTLRITLTRDSAPGWNGSVGRIDLASVQALVHDLGRGREGGGAAECFVCGSAGFVEVASALLVQAGQPAEAIRTERFGPTGT